MPNNYNGPSAYLNVGPTHHAWKGYAGAPHSFALSGHVDCGLDFNKIIIDIEPPYQIQHKICYTSEVITCV